MGLIEYYAIFALTTAILSLIEIFRPALIEATMLGADNEFTNNPKLCYTVYFCISLLTAPYIIFVILIPSFNERTRKALLKVMLEE